MGLKLLLLENMEKRFVFISANCAIIFFKFFMFLCFYFSKVNLEASHILIEWGRCLYNVKTTPNVVFSSKCHSNPVMGAHNLGSHAFT